jgi:two-component system, OmpR family, sensor histidine kinase ChvG
MAEPLDQHEVGWFARLATVRRSLIARLILLIVIFAAVPVTLYEQFKVADAERKALLLDAIREKGVVLSRALTPILAAADATPSFRLGEELARFQTGGASLKLLFRPVGARDGGFLYVASAPPVAADALAIERQMLLDAGILHRLETSCAGDLPLALRVDLPGGITELLTSITPVQSRAGCWALVVASHLDEIGDRSLGQPYWRSPEVQVAAAIYLALAFVVILIFIDVRRSIERFARMARDIRQGRDVGKFTDRTDIPELLPVAAEFDRMVGSLAETATNLRRAAEDTVHAFKTPIGIIRQALELVRRRLPEGDERAMQSASAIDIALNRLDALVHTARELDRAAADLLDPPRERVDFSNLLRGLMRGYRMSLTATSPKLVDEIDRNIAIIGSEDLIETVAENLLDNALSFTPTGREVTVRLHQHRRRVVFTVDDQGPGVLPDRLPKIFERYYSDRSQAANIEAGGENFGVGLWIVRRNIEAMGGRIRALNRPEGGLRMEIELPAA